MNASYLSQAKDALEKMHGGIATHVETVHVTELFQGKPAWDGDVEVFDLVGHSKAKRAYAWGYPDKREPTKIEFVTVLEVPPVNSPQTAIKAAIVAIGRGQYGR